MKIKLVLPEQEEDFIRHARAETLRKLGEEVTATAVEPAPFAFYFIAYDEDGIRPIGMVESVLHHQVYASYADSPYANSYDLTEFCPISRMAGVRTVYVEPEHRHRAGSIYLQLLLVGVRVFTVMGAEFATATTNAADASLGRLCERTGGNAMGKLRSRGMGRPDVALFVFDLENLLNHRVMARVDSSLEAEVDPVTIETLRSRDRAFGESSASRVRSAPAAR